MRECISQILDLAKNCCIFFGNQSDQERELNSSTKRARRRSSIAINTKEKLYFFAVLS